MEKTGKRHKWTKFVTQIVPPDREHTDRDTECPKLSGFCLKLSDTHRIQIEIYVVIL
jgi:hypothetical protein